MKNRILFLLVSFILLQVHVNFFSMHNPFFNQCMSQSKISITNNNGVFNQSSLQKGDSIFVTPVRENGDLVYKWDDVFVSARESESVSHTIILKNVPYGGFYKKFRVHAQYSSQQDSEEYKLVLNGNIGEIISDQYSEENIGQDIMWLWNDHGLRYLNEGDNTVYFIKGNQEIPPGKSPNPRNTNSVHFNSIRITIPPHIEQEPEFTQGLSNTITWIPIDKGAYYQEVVYFDLLNGLSKQKSDPLYRTTPQDTFRTFVFENLTDGHKYGYFVNAYNRSGTIIETSDTTFSTQDASPPEKVQIDSIIAFKENEDKVMISWQGVSDKTSGVNSYKLYRLQTTDSPASANLRAVIPADCTDTGGDVSSWYSFADSIDTPFVQYKYRVDAVDNVGNVSTGQLSHAVEKLIPPELAMIPEPVLVSEATDQFYHKGCKVELLTNIENVPFPAFHYIQFQAVRDSLKFFDNQFMPGKHFFTSGWKELPTNDTTVSDTFDLRNDGQHKINFVNGHRYYFRARFKDAYNNFSEWTSPDTLWSIPDCFPPDDISHLKVTPATNKDNTSGWMALEWEGAIDYTSGIDNYLIYRKTNSADTTFQLAAKTMNTTFADSFQNINYNGEVSYRIGSEDKVGNRRDDTMTNFEVTVTSHSAPAVSFIDSDADTVINGIRYTTNSEEFINVKLNHFEKFGNAKLIYNVNGKQYETNSELLSQNTIPIPMTVEGKYVVKAKVLFPDKSMSLWSKPDSIIKVNDFEEVEKSSDPVPAHRKILVQCYPNPFNMSTNISFNLEKDSDVIIEVYNVQGRKIRTLLNRRETQGLHNVVWEGYNDENHIVSSGIYYYRIHAGNENGATMSKTGKMVLIK